MLIHSFIVLCVLKWLSHTSLLHFLFHMFFNYFLDNQLLINHIQYNIRRSVVFPLSLPTLVIAVVDWPLSYAN